jgi:hypothetical protein
MTRRVSPKRAARAARQLLYHRGRLSYLERKLAENSALLETFLIQGEASGEAEGKGGTVLPGGYVVERAPTGEIAVREGASGTSPESGLEQLEIGGLQDDAA